MKKTIFGFSLALCTLFAVMLANAEETRSCQDASGTSIYPGDPTYSDCIKSQKKPENQKQEPGIVGPSTHEPSSEDMGAPPPSPAPAYPPPEKLREY